MSRLVAAAFAVALTGLVAAPQEHFVRLGGPQGSLRVRYLTEGKASSHALVLVHGWACNAAFWRLQSTDLSRFFRVISIDLPGHGKSDKPAKLDYTVALYADAIAAVMRDAGAWASALIAGHSMGAPVAMQAVLDHPERFAGYVSVDGAIWRYSGPRSTNRPSPYVQRLLRDYEGAAGGRIESMFAPSTPESLREEIRERMLRMTPHVAASELQNLPLSDVWGRMPSPVPVLAVVASSARDDDRRALCQEYFPNLEFEVFENAGHFLMMEQPARFDQLVIEFAKRVGALTER